MIERRLICDHCRSEAPLTDGFDSHGSWSHMTIDRAGLWVQLKADLCPVCSNLAARLTIESGVDLRWPKRPGEAVE